jgi:hypothetical protein
MEAFGRATRWASTGLVLLLLAGPGWAQNKKAAAPQQAKPTVYDFEADTIEGDLTKPDVEFIEAGSRVKHSNLIRVREHFKEKVMQSVGEL